MSEDIRELRILIHGAVRYDGKGYDNRKTYCPRCRLVFALDPPIGKIHRCIFCGSNVRYAARNPLKAKRRRDDLPRIDPLEYDVIP